MQWGYNMGPVIVIQEQTYPRKQLQMLGDGPWLEPRPPKRGWLPVGVLVGVGLLAQHETSGMAWGLGAVALTIGLVTWAFDLHRRQIQVCPECLHGMQRGATSCRCGFHTSRRAA